MCIATMVSPFGMRTFFPPCNTATLLSHGQIAGRKWIVHPDSETASYKGGVASVKLKWCFNKLLELLTTDSPLPFHCSASAPPCIALLVAV